MKPARAKLLAHIRLYVLADILDVSQLTKLSSASIQVLLNVVTDPDDLLEPTTLVMTAINPNDLELRVKVLEHCAKHIDESKPELALLLQKHEPLAWFLVQAKQAEIRILEDTALSMKIDRAQLETEVEHQKEEVARAMELRKYEVTRAEEQQEKEVERALNSIRDAARVLTTHDQCRNPRCRGAFGVYVEPYANGYLKALRCKQCGCRHTAKD